MTTTYKIAMPMAGYGSRLRPHTYSRPKPLLSIAGKTVLEYVMDLFQTLPGGDAAEFVFIVGYLGEQIQAYIRERYPEINAHFVYQKEMRGQSEALYLAREYLSGPTLMVFPDTLVETDFSFLAHEPNDIVAWVREVPDPRSFGVAITDSSGCVSRLVEKPDSMENKLVVVGFYYFKEGEALISAIDEQMRRGVRLRNEYFLADAVNIMLERGAGMRVHPVQTWLDAGTPKALLETNQYLLHHGRDNSAQVHVPAGVALIPPVNIHPAAVLESSVIGPYASIGKGCRITGSVVRNTIIEEGTHIRDLLLEGSVIGQHVRVNGAPARLNLGDLSWINPETP